MEKEEGGVYDVNSCMTLFVIRVETNGTFV